MNHISPCNHPESGLSGSTVESMIDRTVELGLKHFAIADTGSMSSIIRGYKYAQKKGVKVIPGLEIVFRDSACGIIADTESGKIKYFKLLIHAQDQEALQKLTLQYGILNLGSQVEYFDIPKGKAHDAKEDIRMTVDVYKAYISLMKSKKDNISGVSSNDLLSIVER